MTLWTCVRKEILHRKAGFGLGLLSICVAMTAGIGAVVLVRAHDLQTERILLERQRETQAEMQRMEDDYRRITRELGYNTLILSDRQDLAELRADGHPSETMPLDYAHRLAHGRIETLNHLLPVLQKRVRWPKMDLDILLSGTPGQTPIVHLTQFLTADGTAYRSPIMETVPPGDLILGHDIARALSLQPGDTTVLMGTEFRIRRVLPAEGTTDDIAVWCHLDWMHEQLGMHGKINLILALECICDADSLGLITAEVQNLLPDVQVLEFSSRTKVRAQARNRAAEAHRDAMVAERRHRQEISEAQRRFASILIPLVFAGAALWIFFLFLNNARERRMEIGILRALGLSEATLLSAFIFKSLAMGLLGAGIGFLAGHVLGATWSGISLLEKEMWTLMDFRLLLAALLAAPALCGLAAWVPAVRAIRQDPARILCEE